MLERLNQTKNNIFTGFTNRYPETIKLWQNHSDYIISKNTRKIYLLHMAAFVSIGSLFGKNMEESIIAGLASLVIGVEVQEGVLQGIRINFDSKK